MESKPLINLDLVDRVFGELQEMDVKLDADPLGGGPSRLQKKIASVRNFLNRIQKWFQMFSHKEHLLKRSLRASEASYNLKVADLLAHDPDVKLCRSMKDREAVAQIKLKDEFLGKLRLSDAVFETSGVLAAIKVKERDLKDTSARLRDQMRLCQDELSLGRRWGSKIPDSHFELKEDKGVTAALEDEIDMTLIDLVGKEVREQESEVSVRADLEEEEDEEEDDAGKKEESSAEKGDEEEEEDVDALLDRIDITELEEFFEKEATLDFDPNAVDELSDILGG